jgi:hypothetical protein
MTVICHDKCPLCSSNAIKKRFACIDNFATGEQFDIYECCDCGMVFTRNFPDEKAKLRFFREMTDKLTCPVYYGYPYGHETSIRALDFSSTAEIKDGTLTFKF